MYLVHGGFMIKDLVELHDSGYGENASNDPVEIGTAVPDPLSEPASPENKKGIAHKGPKSNADDISIVLRIHWLQYLLRKKYRAPAEPEWYLYRIDGTHTHS